VLGEKPSDRSSGDITSVNSPNDLFVDERQEAYYTEKQLLDTLDELSQLGERFDEQRASD